VHQQFYPALAKIREDAGRKKQKGVSAGALTQVESSLAIVPVAVVAVMIPVVISIPIAVGPPLAAMRIVPGVGFVPAAVPSVV